MFSVYALLRTLLCAIYVLASVGVRMTSLSLVAVSQNTALWALWHAHNR